MLKSTAYLACNIRTPFENTRTHFPHSVLNTAIFIRQVVPVNLWDASQKIQSGCMAEQFAEHILWSAAKQHDFKEPFQNCYTRGAKRQVLEVSVARQLQNTTRNWSSFDCTNIQKMLFLVFACPEIWLAFKNWLWKFHMYTWILDISGRSFQRHIFNSLFV